MGKNLGEILNNIMEENATSCVEIFTQNLHILGTIHNYHEKCQNCHDCLIALKDVKVGCLKSLLKSETADGQCPNVNYKEYDWFNISTSAVVGFSIVKQ